jgi:hypothetical protein
MGERKHVKWMETIKVQAAVGQNKSVERSLRALAHHTTDHPDCSGFLYATVYRHAVVQGFSSIHLFWDTEHPQIHGSTLGLSLLQAVKTMGVADHAVWIEERNNQALLPSQEGYHE